MFGSELSENFAVELKAIFLQFTDEGAVGFVTVVAKRSIEADDPQLAKVGLLVATMGEGIATRTHKCFMSVTFFLGAYTAITLSSLENILAALLRHDPSLNSCHI